MIQRRDRADASGWKPRLRFPAHAPEHLVERVSTDELVQLLLRVGAKILAAHDHGIFLEARRHLIFLRRAAVIGGAELEDALRAAAVGPGRFDLLLAEIRNEAAPSQTAVR